MDTSRSRELDAQEFDAARIEGQVTSGTPNRRILSTHHGIRGGTTYAYDGYDRAIRMTDACVGTSTNWFDAADPWVATATPPPGSELDSQVTSFEFDPTRQITNTMHPDAMTTTNHFFVTALPRKTAGARTYPVAYTHDHAGRMKTMMTWTDAASGAASAVTTWNVCR